MAGTLHSTSNGDNIYSFSVKVATPCTCGLRWFQCDCSDVIAAVECYGTSPYKPCDEHIAWAHAQYPGMSLIY